MELYGTKGSIIGPDPNMFGGPVSISGELGSEWRDISAEDKPLGKTNIINHSGRSNEAPKQANYRGIGLAEMIEIKDHPWFIGCQFHPEFTSSPLRGHPLFQSFIQAAVEYSKKK